GLPPDVQAPVVHHGQEVRRNRRGSGDRKGTPMNLPLTRTFPRACALCCLLLGGLLLLPWSPAAERTDLVEATHGVAVSVSPPASDTGVEVLRQDGNAVDAAVATAFVLAVTWPAAGNIGGGGYLVVYPTGHGEPVVFDFRETAPAAATRDMF